VLWAVSSRVERLTAIRRFSGVSPQPPDLKVVFDTLRVGNVELVVRLTAEVAKKVGYYGCFDPSAYRGTPTGSTYRLRRS